MFDDGIRRWPPCFALYPEETARQVSIVDAMVARRMELAGESEHDACLNAAGYAFKTGRDALAGYLRDRAAALAAAGAHGGL